MSDDWSEELVSVATDYSISWKQAEGRQAAIDLLLRSAGGGGGCGAGNRGAYSVKAVSGPRIMQPVLTDAEREAIERAIDSLEGVEDLLPTAPITDPADTLRGLLERTK